MLEAIGIGLGLFFCIMIGVGIARWKLGRQDLFKVDERLPDAIHPKEEWERE